MRFISSLFNNSLFMKAKLPPHADLDLPDPVWDAKTVELTLEQIAELDGRGPTAQEQEKL